MLECRSAAVFQIARDLLSRRQINKYCSIILHNYLSSFIFIIKKTSFNLTIILMSSPSISLATKLTYFFAGLGSVAITTYWQSAYFRRELLHMNEANPANQNQIKLVPGSRTDVEKVPSL